MRKDVLINEIEELKNEIEELKNKLNDIQKDFINDYNLLDINYLDDAIEFYKNYTSNDDVYDLDLYDTLEEEFIEQKEVINKYPE